MNWELRLRKKVRKSIARFPKENRRHIVEALREISFNPYTGDIVKLGGEDNSWRRRIGDHRIFYEIFIKEKVIYVFRIERRTSKTY